MKIAAYLIVAISMSACGTAPMPAPAAPTANTASASATTAVAFDPREKLAKMLIGVFDSAQQSAADAENYKPISLQICEVTAPTLGTHVLYVEQAVTTALDKPYRQRLYVIESGTEPTTAVSRVLELKSPEPAVGLCGKPGRASFAATDADEKVGCAVVMTWTDGQFIGGTKGNVCPSALRGATYATSEVTLNEQGMHSWDRGYDAAGAQVWGADKGAYIFVRK